MIKSFHDLQAYQNSKQLYAEIVKIVNRFPKRGEYLANQMRRASNSINANIAEGFGRSEAEFKKFLTSALGSNNEILSHLEDAQTSGFINTEECRQLTDLSTMVGKQIFRLKEKWRKF